MIRCVQTILYRHLTIQYCGQKSGDTVSKTRFILKKRNCYADFYQIFLFFKKQFSKFAAEFNNLKNGEFEST